MPRRTTLTEAEFAEIAAAYAAANPTSPEEERRVRIYSRLFFSCLGLAGAAAIGLMCAAGPMGRSSLTMQQKGNILLAVAIPACLLVFLAILFVQRMMGVRWVFAIMTTVLFAMICMIVASPLVADPITNLLFTGIAALPGVN